MKFEAIPKKGIRNCFIEKGLDTGKLSLHVSRLEGNGRSHPSHVHPGTEAFYVIEGLALIESEDERFEIGPNELVILDATKLHGISNAGSGPMEYMVINAG
jgi:mannose-6-phosphate isomerase-like protein (cupin superfamily)